MMIADPSESKSDSGPSDSVTRVVTILIVAVPFAPASSCGMSPMWYGWFASGFELPAGPGSKWPPADVNGASHLPTSCRCTPCIPSFSPDKVTVIVTSRSEEHTSELQSLRHLVCRLLLEKKKAHK